MKPTQIFLDLDDVCNDFTLPALAEVGCLVGFRDFRKYQPEWGFDIVKVANELRKFRSEKLPQLQVKEFWAQLDYDFWAGLPISCECKPLLAACTAHISGENICILTATIMVQESYVAAAKIDWIYNHLPPWLWKRFLIGSPKHVCAYPGALLIDDSDVNVQAFIGCGGQAILMPRPWNSLHYLTERAEEYVLQQLSQVFS